MTSAKDPPSVEPDDWFDLLDDAPPPAPQVPPSSDHSRKKIPVVTPSVPPDAFSPTAVYPAETWEWAPSPTPPPPPTAALPRPPSVPAAHRPALPPDPPPPPPPERA